MGAVVVDVSEVADDSTDAELLEGSEELAGRSGAELAGESNTELAGRSIAGLSTTSVGRLAAVSATTPTGTTVTY